MTENNYDKLKDAICELVNLAEDATSIEVFEMLDNAGADTIDCLDRLSGYEAIGTIDEFKRAKSMENVYGQVKWERDVAISQLEEIGVSLGQKMDDIKALKEKSVAKKVEYFSETFQAYTCPSCETPINNGGMAKGVYCKWCGQKFDWSE